MSIAESQDGSNELPKVLGTLGFGLCLVILAGWTYTTGLEVLPYALGFAGILALVQGLRGLSNTVAGVWRGIPILLVVWVLFLGLATTFPESTRNPGPVQGITGIVLLLGWIGLPALFYMDAQEVGRTGDWKPWWPLYVLPSIVPVINVVVALLYLFRRHRKVGVP
ncbi:MAG: hypothetical protein ABEJ94_08175 [Halorientalis sp.]